MPRLRTDRFPARIAGGTSLEQVSRKHPPSPGAIVQRLSLISLLSLTSSAAVTLIHLLRGRPGSTTVESSPRAGTPAGAAEAPSLFAPPTAGGLTAAEVARQAAATSNEARADSEAKAAAQAGVSQAKAAFVPACRASPAPTASARWISRRSATWWPSPATVPAGPIPAGTPLVSVPAHLPGHRGPVHHAGTLSLPVSDYLYRLPKLHAAAKGNARSAALLAQATRVRVATDARVAYYGWARARMQADVAARNLVQAQGHLKDVSAASASGAASKADVLRVESQVATAELLLTRARSP
jgi:outer membrane protein TolC